MDIETLNQVKKFTSLLFKTKWSFMIKYTFIYNFLQLVVCLSMPKWVKVGIAEMLLN